MKKENDHLQLIDGYIDLLKNLDISEKLEIISRLSQSLKSDIQKQENFLEKSFGAFESEESAEELAESIRKARTFNRQIEEF